jgi:putative tricarboxylic transport membrane protein
MRWADQLTAMILLGAAFVLGREALRLSYSDASHVPGPGFLPFWLAVGLAVGAAGMLLERRWKALRSSAWFPSRDGMFRVSILTALTVLLVFSIGPLGMYIAVGLYLLAFLAIYMPGRWLVILLVATGSPLTIYLVFERWLKVLMPRSFLGF